MLIFFFCLLLLWSCRVRINKCSHINIWNQSTKQWRLVCKGLGMHNDTLAGVQLPDNWSTKATRSGWWILDPSTNIHPALLTAVDTCTHWVPIFKKTVLQALNIWFLTQPWLFHFLIQLLFSGTAVAIVVKCKLNVTNTVFLFLSPGHDGLLSQSTQTRRGIIWDFHKGTVVGEL